MEVFLGNFYFIWLNSFLAVVAVLFGWLMSKANSSFAKIWTGFIWLIFLPNTIYILTDISHLFESWADVNSLFKLILIFQYGFFSIFGVITFVISVNFFQMLLEGKKTRKKMKITTIISICILNFIVGFAVILGAIARTNSWYIFTNPLRVLTDVFFILYSKELLMLSLGTGILANIIYFICIETLATWGKKLSKKGGL